MGWGVGLGIGAVVEVGSAMVEDVVEAVEVVEVVEAVLECRLWLWERKGRAGRR